MAEFMPILVPNGHCGPQKAVGQVTGTQYLIVPSGTWVWLEDLPGLLQEMRRCCPRTDAPVRAFFPAAGSVGQVVRYRPWPIQAVAVEATGVAEASTNHVEAVEKEQMPVEGIGLEQATSEAKADEEPSQSRRKRKREYPTL